MISSLAEKKRRSIILLRALSFNITRSTSSLDLKQCGDILYSIAVLNFPDENLLQRVCIDACKEINNNLQKSSVLGSILTSLGLLKYKDNSKYLQIQKNIILCIYYMNLNCRCLRSFLSMDAKSLPSVQISRFICIIYHNGCIKL